MGVGDDGAVHPLFATLPALDDISPLEVPPPTLPPLDPPPSLRGTAEPPPLSLRGTADPVVLPLDVRSWAAARPDMGRVATANAIPTVNSLWRVITPPRNASERTSNRVGTQQTCQPPVG